MANYANLKAAIDTVIKANGQQEITGTVLNQTLTAMVNSLGAGYLFMGVAIPSTNPGTPDQNVFYLAGQAGTYSNFGLIALQAGLSILKWNGTWSSDTFFTFDATITQNSASLITSGAVFDKMKLDGGAYDVSAHNNNQTFDSLSALLNDANLSTLIPTNIRSGGMSIKFIQSSDNKYVQFRLMTTSFSTTESDWQGVSDSVEKGSLDVLSSDGAFRYSHKKANIFDLLFVQGSIYQGLMSVPNSDCICCVKYIETDSLGNTLTILNQKQQDGNYWKVRVCFYDENKVYINQDGYDFVDGVKNVAVPNNAKYFRVAISLCNSSGMAIGCTPEDIPTDGTKILYYTDNFRDLYAKDYLLEGKTAGLTNKVFDIIRLLELTYTQGTITNGTLDPSNMECISCMEYYKCGAGDLQLFNQILNTDNGSKKYWKIRCSFYNAFKHYIEQTNYSFVAGYSNVNIPTNAVYVRFSISLCRASNDSAIGCTPASILDDGTEVLCNSLSIAKLSDLKKLDDSIAYLLNRYIEGNDTEYIQEEIHGLVPGNTYYISFKNPNWGAPSSIQDNQNKFAIDNVYNGNSTLIFSYKKNETIPSFMSIVIPANSDYLIIGGRAVLGERIEFCISEANPNIDSKVNNLESRVDNLYAEQEVFEVTFNQGSINPAGIIDTSNTECIYDENFYPIKGLPLLIANQKQQDGNYWKVAIAFYNRNKGFLSRYGYNFTDGLSEVLTPDGAVFIRIAISLCNSSGTAIGCTPSDIPSDGTKITIKEGVIPKIQREIEILSNALISSVNILGFTYKQGTLYNGNPDTGNTECIYCENYFTTNDMSELLLTNEKQQDGKYWKVRVAFYNSQKYFISQNGYSFIEGTSDFAIPSAAKYMRFAISLCNSSGTAIDCTPSDIPTDGTEITYLNNNVNQLESDVKEQKSDVEQLQSEVEGINAPLPLNKLLGYNFSYLFGVTSGYGDAACYNGLIFQFINGNEYVYVHNATDGTLVQTITMPNPNTKYHNNSVTFGSAKYDEGDTYPLLYASQENSAENKCIVYRVTGTTGNLTFEVVQTITYPANSATGLYYHNCYIDTKNNYLILSGLVNSSWSAVDNNTLQYMAFELPELSDGDVTLDMADVLFKSPRFANMPTTQGGFCKNGYLYQVFGVSAPQLFMIFDIKNCKFCYIFNFTEELMNSEPEGAFEYNNKVHVVFNGGAIYQLTHLL